MKTAAGILWNSKRECASCRRVRVCKYKGGTCHTCHREVAGKVQRRVNAPCLDGCGRIGRSMSGYAKPCYRRIWQRGSTFKRLTGSTLPLTTVVEVLGRVKGETRVDEAALAAVRRLARDFMDGRLNILRNTQIPKRP